MENLKLLIDNYVKLAELKEGSKSSAKIKIENDFKTLRDEIYLNKIYEVFDYIKRFSIRDNTLKDYTISFYMSLYLFNDDKLFNSDILDLYLIYENSFKYSNKEFYNVLLQFFLIKSNIHEWNINKDFYIEFLLKIYSKDYKPKYDFKQKNNLIESIKEQYKNGKVNINDLIEFYYIYTYEFKLNSDNFILIIYNKNNEIIFKDYFKNYNENDYVLNSYLLNFKNDIGYDLKKYETEDKIYCFQRGQFIKVKIIDTKTQNIIYDNLYILINSDLSKETNEAYEIISCKELNEKYTVINDKLFIFYY